MILKLFWWQRLLCQRRTRQPCVVLSLLCLLLGPVLLWSHLHLTGRKTYVIVPDVMDNLSLVTRGGGTAADTPCLTSKLYDVDCRRMVEGDETYFDELLNRTVWELNTKCTQYSWDELLSNCDNFKQRHGYYRWPVTVQEKNFPLAFGLKVHHAPDMVERLLRVIWRPHNFYCIHVDKKAPDIMYEAVRNLTQCFHNVFMAEQRISVVYLSAGSLYSDIECMKLAMKSHVKWKYYLNLSGQEFPLKTNFEIVQILTALNGTNDIESYPTPKSIYNWYSRKHIILNGTLRRTKTNKTTFPYPIHLRKGSAYGSFSRQFLEFVFTDIVAQKLLDWLNDTWAPDELYWATLNYLHGVPGAVYSNVSHDDSTVLSRAVAWYWDEYKCRGTSVRAICVFSAFDLPWLASRPELIANKFNNSRDPIALDCLEQLLENRTAAAYRTVTSSAQNFPYMDNLNWAHYQSLPHLQSAWPH